MDTYTPEEFAQRLKSRGLVRYIADARRYTEQTGKEFYTENDFEEAYHSINTEKVGRSIIRESTGEGYAYYKKDRFGEYWFVGEKEL